MIDWERVRELKLEIGPEDFGDVVAVFLQEADDVVARLAGLTDARSIENDLHFLKGSALNLGFADLAQICQMGELNAAIGAADVGMQAVLDTYRMSRALFLGGVGAWAA